MRTKHKLGIVFALLLSLILLPSVSAGCYVWTLGNSCDINRVFWDSDDYTRLLSGAERTDWIEITDKTTAGLTTDCYEHKIEGLHHSIYCDRTATEIGSYDFLAYFKNSNVKDLSITEIARETKTQTYYEVIGEKEIVCAKGSLNETKGIKCYENVKKPQTISWEEIREIPVIFGKEGIFDYKAVSKIAFTKDQKRTYRIEWEDAEPVAIREIMQGTTNEGQLSFPAQEYYSNELKINPVTSYNSTINNWGGVASNSGLDASNNITALLSGGSSTWSLNMPSTINHTMNEWGRMEVIGGDGGSGWIFHIVAGTEMKLNNNTIFEINGGSTDYGECNGFTLNIKQGATQGVAFDNTTTILALTTNGADWSNHINTGTYLLHNLTGGTGGGATIPVGAKFYGLFIPITSSEKCGISFSNAIMLNSVALYHGKTASEYVRDPAIAVITLTTTASTYSTSGNRTLDGFCPDYPNLYTWSNATLTSWNSGTNVGNMTLSFANDNSTWSTPIPYANLQMVTNSSACVKMIPDVTTTGASTTPRISGATINYKSTISPTISITYPVESATYYSTNISVNVSVYDADGIGSLFFDNMLVNTTIPFPQNSSTIPHDGVNKIVAYVNDTDGLSNRTEVSFNVNLPPSLPVANAPANQTNFTAIPTLSLNASTDTDTIYYYFEVDDDAGFTSASTSGSILLTSYTPTITEGGYYWRALATDTYGNSSWTIPRYFSIDSTAPLLYLDSPTNKIYYQLINDLNYSVIDSNLDKVVYNFGTGNFSLMQNTSLTFNQKSNTLTIWANDSMGNYNSTSVTFFVNIITTNVAYETPVVVSQPQNIYLNISASQVNGINGTLFYNNTAISSTASYNSTFGQLKATFNTPIFNTTTLQSLYWNYTLNNISYLSSLYNQTIKAITPLVVNDSCSTGLSEAMCFDFKEETNLTQLSADITYNFLFGAYSGFNQAVYGSKNNTNSFCLCVNSTAYNNYTINSGEIHYSRTGYTPRNFYTFSNNRISNVTINNTLYLLPSASATSFLFEFKTTSLANYIGKFASLLRWYPDLNEYRVVEMGRTDNKGQTIMRVQVEDVDYRVGLYETTGELIKLLNATRFACLSSPCSYSTQIATSESDYTSIYGVETSIDYNEATYIWTYIWNDPSQKTQSMRFKVTRERGDSSTTICDTTGSGTTGVLTCDSTGYTGTLKGIAYRTASPETPLAQKIIDTLSTPFRSSSGLFISFIILVLMAFVGIFSPIAVIVLAVVGLVVALKLGVITIAIFIPLGAVIGLVIHFLKRT